MVTMYTGEKKKVGKKGADYCVYREKKGVD